MKLERTGEEGVGRAANLVLTSQEMKEKTCLICKKQFKEYEVIHICEICHGIFHRSHYIRNRKMHGPCFHDENDAAGGEFEYVCATVKLEKQPKGDTE